MVTEFIHEVPFPIFKHFFIAFDHFSYEECIRLHQNFSEMF